MSVDYAALSINEAADVAGEFCNPDTEACNTGWETARIITVDVGILIVSQAVHIIGICLCDASRRVLAINKLAWQWLSVALSSGQIVIVVIQGDMEARIRWGHAGDVVQGGIEWCSLSKMVGPVRT